MDRAPFPIVTLLGTAVDSDGSIWCAADTRSVGKDACSGDAYDVDQTGKLYAIGETVVWGLYGDGVIAAHLRHGLLGHPFAFWGDLVTNLRTELLRQNGTDLSSGLLIAGRLLDPDGKPQPRLAWINAANDLRENEQVQFAGNGRIAAKVAWDALAFAPRLTIQHRLMVTMLTAIDEMPTFLGFPLLVWHIPADGSDIEKESLSRDDVVNMLGSDKR